MNKPFGVCLLPVLHRPPNPLKAENVGLLSLGCGGQKFGVAKNEKVGCKRGIEVMTASALYVVSHRLSWYPKA